MQSAIIVSLYSEDDADTACDTKPHANKDVHLTYVYTDN